MAYVAGLVERPRFCRPGQPPLEIPGVKHAWAWVLGPPEDEELLSRSDPHGSEAYEETGMALNPENAFFGAAVNQDLAAANLPFDEHFRIPIDALGKYPDHDEFFKKHYGIGEDAQGHRSAWRRIDNDWLLRSGQLALNLDGDTNNTSLALAIELLPGGQVLLFPGDAQVGSTVLHIGRHIRRTQD